MLYPVSTFFQKSVKTGFYLVMSYNIDFTTYSTTPVRVGTWKDGRPLWRVSIPTQTFNVTANTPFSAQIDLSPYIPSNFGKITWVNSRYDALGANDPVDFGTAYFENGTYFRTFARRRTLQVRILFQTTTSNFTADYDIFFTTNE